MLLRPRLPPPKLSLPARASPSPSAWSPSASTATEWSCSLSSAISTSSSSLNRHIIPADQQVLWALSLIDDDPFESLMDLKRVGHPALADWKSLRKELKSGWGPAFRERTPQVKISF